MEEKHPLAFGESALLRHLQQSREGLPRIDRIQKNSFPLRHQRHRGVSHRRGDGIAGPAPVPQGIVPGRDLDRGLQQLRPSVEAGFHSILDTYVAHSHSVYANLAACSEELQDIVKKALADADYTWGWVPYVDPGARLTFSIRARR